jgi:hypothetical protein
VYQDINVADDIDINSLSSLTTPDNASDQLLIYDADGRMNKKITPGNLFTPKAVMGTAPIVSSNPTGTSTSISMDVTLLAETTSAGASDTLLIEQSGVNKKITPGNLITPKAVTGTAPIVSSDPTGTSTAISIDITSLSAATGTNFADYLLIYQGGVNKKVQKYILVPEYTADTGLTRSSDYQFSFTGGDLGAADITTSGDMTLTGLGTTDPEVVGQLWNDSGTVKISAGPPTYSLTILAYDTEHLDTYTITINGDSKEYNYTGPYTHTWTGLTGSTQSWAITAGSYTCYISGLSNCTTTGDGQSSTGTYLATITDTGSNAQFRIDIEQ